MDNLNRFFSEISREKWADETKEIRDSFSVVIETESHIQEYRTIIREECEKEIEVIKSSVLPSNTVEKIIKTLEQINCDNPALRLSIFTWIVWKEDTLRIIAKGMRFEKNKLTKLAWSKPTGHWVLNEIKFYSLKFDARIVFACSNDDDYYWAYVRTSNMQYRWFKCDDLRGFLKLIHWYVENIKGLHKL